MSSVIRSWTITCTIAGCDYLFRTRSSSCFRNGMMNHQTYLMKLKRLY